MGRIAGRTPLAVRLGGSRWVWTAMALPFLYFGVLPLGTTFARGDALPGGMVAVALVGAIAGFLSGVGVVAASRNRHAKAMVADAETVVRFAASAPARDRRVTTWAVAGLFGAAILGFVGSALLDFAPLRWLFQLLVPAGTALYGTTTERRVTISDAGIVVATPAYKHLRSWSAYESFDVTDEEIVVRRAGWSPWGLRDFRRDATEVEDPERSPRPWSGFCPASSLTPGRGAMAVAVAVRWRCCAVAVAVLCGGGAVAVRTAIATASEEAPEARRASGPRNRRKRVRRTRFRR
ncbi:hypothetical protein [Halorussus caseinilyticus]|uniref:PH domain-containing protein n=1 Tax=Halorussus caseinilyticus TaxID=3034025 RepID=A0ABD5WK92_9EURY